jgi:hypothetical protein
MPWYDAIRFFFSSSEEEKESIIFKNASKITEAAVEMADERDLAKITIEENFIVKHTNGGRNSRVVGKLKRRERLIKGQKFDMP